MLFVNAQENEQVETITTPKRSIELGPMGDIYMLQFTQTLKPRNELVLGVGYLNTAILSLIEYPGINQIYFGEVGYRHFLWRNLNIEAQLLPQYAHCNDTISNKVTQGFGLTGEIRMGYRFEFNIGKLPSFVHLQWFMGYPFINPRPQSFIDVDGGEFYISPIPMFFWGVKF